MKKIEIVLFCLGVLLSAGCQQAPEESVQQPTQVSTAVQKAAVALVEAADGRLLQVDCVAKAARGEGNIASCTDHRGMMNRGAMGTPNGSNEMGRGCGVTANNFTYNYSFYASYYVVYDPTRVPCNTACSAAGVGGNCSGFYNSLGYNYNTINQTGIQGYNYNNFTFGTNFNTCNQWWKYYWFR
jgi:hypothetical protein